MNNERSQAWFSRVWTSLHYLLLILLAVMMIGPFVWMFSSSLKTREYILRNPPQLIPNPASLQSYQDLADTLPLDTLFFNSLIMAGLGTIGQVVVSAMAAYAFSRMEWPGRNTVFLIYLATLMVPTQVTIIPQFILVRELGWVNSYQGLIVPTLFSAFGTFLLRQFFLGLPRELEEAAFIDGANHFTIFWRIILPLSRPALGTLTVFSFMGLWNSYLWPLFVARHEMYQTLNVGLAELQGGPRALTQWNLVMAGAILSVLPILTLYLIAQKSFVRGVALTGIKG